MLSEAPGLKPLSQLAVGIARVVRGAIPNDDAALRNESSRRQDWDSEIARRTRSIRESTRRGISSYHNQYACG